jgi:hypothetical protein
VDELDMDGLYDGLELFLLFLTGQIDPDILVWIIGSWPAMYVQFVHFIDIEHLALPAFDRCSFGSPGFGLLLDQL